MRKVLVVAGILGLSVYAFAQFGGIFGGGSRSRNTGPPISRTCLVPGYGASEDARSNHKDSGFVYARVRYNMHSWWRSETPEAPWHHDFPDGDTMFPTSLVRLTTVETSPESFQIVDIDSKELFKYPFIYISEPGFLDLRPADVKNLKEYFDRGGFLLLDDFRGNASDRTHWQNMEEQMRKIFPDRQIKPVTASHQIFQTFFDVNPDGMEPPYRMQNSGDVQFFGIEDSKGRIQVMIDYNNDIGEFLQALDLGTCSLHDAGTAVELAVNYVIYSMTH